MIRTKFEALEKRQMFAASSLSDGAGARFELSPTSGGEVALQLAGDFNADGAADLASFAARRAMILPYIEQDNIYKNRTMLHELSPVVDVADGTSNTMMFRGAAGEEEATSRSIVDVWDHDITELPGENANGIIAILIGLAADPSDRGGEVAVGSHWKPIVNGAADFDNDGDVDGADFLVIGKGAPAGATALLDVWEHGFSSGNGADSQGIIAVLIGLTADPSDPTGNTLHSNFCMCDGSVRFTRNETSGLTESQLAAQQDAVTASLLASDEYFARLHRV
jgi:hypothetical protein